MKVKEIMKILDKEFFETRIKENLINWAVTEDNKDYIYQPFLNDQTGLMLKASDTIDEVFTCVFVTDEIIEKVCSHKNSLLFTHHNFDYYEDERGLCAIRVSQIEKLIENGISLYVAHAGLDTHDIYGTSLSLAELLNIKVEKYFYDYFGSPTALIGVIEGYSFDDYSEFVKEQLERPFLTIEKYNDNINKIAVVGGGGDEPEILRQAFELGADTFIAGTVEHKWEVPFIQETNRKFRELNKELKLNLIGGTHYGTERPAMINVVKYFNDNGIKCSYIEDESLLIAK